MGNTRMFHKARRSEMSTKPPREGLVNALVSNSKGKTFEEARREWTSDGEKITWEDAEFHEHCPCGAKLEVANYILVNQITGRKLQIGSDCIRKFIILTGTETQEDSRKAFDRLVYNVQRDAELVRLAPNILQPRVRVAALFRFRAYAQSYLGHLQPGDISAENWQRFIRLINIDESDRNSLRRLRDVLFRPGLVPKDDSAIQLESSSEDQLREELGWRKASKGRAKTTLSDSEIYHPENYVQKHVK